MDLTHSKCPGCNRDWCAPVKQIRDSVCCTRCGGQMTNYPVDPPVKLPPVDLMGDLERKWPKRKKRK